jgi:alanine transaminase
MNSYFIDKTIFLFRCGSRGGYYELINLDKDVKLQVNKLISASLCSTAWGQAVMGAIINPPKEGEESYELYKKERSSVVNRLKEKADLVSQLFNSVEGVRCNTVMGLVITKKILFIENDLFIFSAMYAFPRVEIPKKAIEHAKSKNMAPDAFYCFQLLEKTGICVVPGSGFKQLPDTHHLRTTILPPIDQMKDMVERFRTFHMSFLREWK